MAGERYGIVFERYQSYHHPAGEEPYGNIRKGKFELSAFKSLDSAVRWLHDNRYFSMQHSYDLAKIYELEDDQSPKEKPVKVFEFGWYEKDGHQTN